MTTALEIEARTLLAQLPADRASWPPLRWIVRADAFDGQRQQLQKAGVLVATVGQGEPTILGLPYDFGQPTRPALITLAIAAPACANAAD